MIDPADDRTIPLFPEALAELEKLCAGKPYRPSNATEGEYFTSQWCGECANATDDEYGCTCPIYLNSMIDNVPEWIIDPHGQPKCTAFVAEVA